MPRGIPGSSPTAAHAAKAAYARDWRAKNRDHVREYMRRFGGRYGRYGLPPEQWQEMVDRYAGLCWSCREEPATDLDHDHATGENRGALCNGCNQGLGGFRDKPERLRAAAAYLEGGQ